MGEEEGMMEKAKAFWKNMIRVFRVASKPDMEEFTMSSKITGIGMVLAGAIGFILFIIFQFIGIF